MAIQSNLPVETKRKTNRLARISFFGLIIIPLIFILGFVVGQQQVDESTWQPVAFVASPIIAIACIVSGAIATRRIRKSNKTQKGLVFSILGIVFGTLFLLLFLFFWISIILYSLELIAQ